MFCRSATRLARASGAVSRSTPLQCHNPAPLDPGNYKVKKPGRKGLDEILKLELLQQASPAAIMNLWMTHHQQYKHYWGRVITAEAYDAMITRLRENPFFVIPVFRDKGLFNVVTNFQAGEDLVICCPLGEWQKQQGNATCHMTVQFFTELKNSKGIVLMRAELKDNHMNKSDAMFVSHCLIKYYTFPQNFEYVETFNKNPTQFNYHNYLRQMRDEARADGKAEGVEIVDEKARTWEQAYTKTVDPTAGS